MTIDDLHRSIKDNYRIYNTVIKPLIADIESREQAFPLPVFNEIRAFNDHIAQCYIDGATDETIQANIHQSERHIKRIVLDCYKYLNVNLFLKIKRFERQTRRIDLTAISNGVFYIKYLELNKNAVKLIKEAKKVESNDPYMASSIFESAYNTYTDLEDLIDDHMTEVNWARVKFSLRSVLKVVLWLLAAILSGVISVYLAKALS